MSSGGGSSGHRISYSSAMNAKVSDPVEKLKLFTSSRGSKGFDSLYRNLQDVSQSNQNGGKLNKEEYIKALSGFGYPATNKEMGDVFDALDSDKEGLIDPRKAVRDIDSSNHRRYGSFGGSSSQRRGTRHGRGDRESTHHRLDFMERKWLSEIENEDRGSGTRSSSQRRYSEGDSNRNGHHSSSSDKYPRRRSRGRPKPNYYKEPSDSQIEWLNKWHESMKAPSTALKRSKDNPFNLSPLKSGKISENSGNGKRSGYLRRSHSEQRRPTAARHTRANSVEYRGRY